MLLCTLADVKTMLGITDTTDDDLITMMIKQASSKVQSYIGYKLERATYTDEVHAVNNRQLLILNACPIQSVTSASIYGNEVTDYEITPEYAKMGMLYRGAGWVGNYYVRGMTHDVVSGCRDIKVTYVAGWYLPSDDDYSEGDDASLPYEITTACIQAVVEKYRINALSAEGIKSHSEGGISDSFAVPTDTANSSAGLSVSVLEQLDSYKRTAVA